MRSSNQLTPRILGELAIAVIVGAGSYLYLNSSPPVITNKSIKSLTISSQPQTTTPAIVTHQMMPVYKNGTYSATANYSVPSGTQNDIKVILTIMGDTITAVTTNNNISESQSQYYVDSFNSNINSAVVGSALTDAYAGRVGGASLTSNAFNDALRTIVNDAKA